MSKISIFGGAGRMGQATAYFMHMLGHEITVVDYEKLINIPDYIDFLSIYDSSDNGLLGRDLVISCMPAENNLKLAESCLKYNSKYCDLGGDEIVSEQFRDVKEKWTNAVFTELGLAPGLVNILAWEIYQSQKERGEETKDLLMYVGGVTEHSWDNILGWMPTWSVSGLMKNYRNKVTCIEKGEIIQKNPLSDYHLISLPKLSSSPILEAFLTSGGLGHTIYDIGAEVQNVKYFTLRWPGYLRVIESLRTMIKDGLMFEDNAIKFLTNTTSKDCRDVVFIKVWGGKTCYELKISGNDDWSAMQVATAGPVAIIAAQMLENDMKGYLTYRDIDYPAFQADLLNLYKKCGLVTDYTSFEVED